MKILLALACLATGCAPTRVVVAPVKVEPIHMTIDVNLHGDSTVPAKPTSR